MVVKNQLRAALTVIKTKSAALHYESNISQLFAAGADVVGDYGHSHHMFVLMLKAACAYIDKEVSKFLTTPLPNTGMPPHFYITGDKSTNHRVTNQVTLICPVVDGRRQAIALNVCKMYQNSDGSGGTGPELATKMIEDVQVAMQGKVTDGQYINTDFINAITSHCLTNFQATSKINFGGIFNGILVTGSTRSSLCTMMVSLFHVFCPELPSSIPYLAMERRILLRTRLPRNLCFHSRQLSVSLSNAL